MKQMDVFLLHFRVRRTKLSEKWRNRLPEIDIIPLVKTEINSDDDDDVSDYEIKPTKNTRRNSPKKQSIKSTKKIVYKNPFNYTSCNVNKVMKVRTEKPPEIKYNKWTCMICSEVQPDKNTLIAHYEFHKNEKKEAADEADILGDYFICHICSKEFTSLKSFTKHIDEHSENHYSCDVCNKTYKNIFQLCIHNFNLHCTDGKYHCILCDFKTAFKKSLTPHIKKHEQKYKYKCDICGKGFLSLTWFEEHQNFHTGAMPFGCDLCGKSFSYTRYLVAHKKSAHPEASSDPRVINECHICKKRFAHKKSLILHVRGHTGENSVLCDMCGKRLSSSEHFKQHFRIHTGYKPHICGVCGKGFAKKCNLTLHERVHSGEKPYVCKHCSKCFAQRSTLVIHERYHTGERPYVCKLCNKGFVARGLLGVHMKTSCKVIM